VKAVPNTKKREDRSRIPFCGNSETCGWRSKSEGWPALVGAGGLNRFDRLKKPRSKIRRPKPSETSNNSAEPAEIRRELWVVTPPQLHGWARNSSSSAFDPVRKQGPHFGGCPPRDRLSLTDAGATTLSTRRRAKFEAFRRPATQVLYALNLLNPMAELNTGPDLRQARESGPNRCQKTVAGRRRVSCKVG